MRLRTPCLCLAGAAMAIAACARPAPPTPPMFPKFAYPAAPRGDTVDNYHGTPIADPYRWLEDPDTPESQKWIAAQNKLTFGFLDGIPERAPIRERLTQLWNYERYSPPSRKAHRYFYTRNDGLQNQAVLYTTVGLGDEPTVLLDPNALSADGTVALAGTAVSEDGRYLAYGLATAGSDWNEWRVRDIETGKDAPDLLKWVKFSGASWTHDGAGFYYSRYREPTPGQALEESNYFQKLYYHRLGTPQEQDVLVFERPDQKEWMFDGTVTDDGKFLLITVVKGTDDNCLLYVQDLTAPAAPIKQIVGDWSASFSYLGNDGPVFWFKTDSGAPRYRIVAIDIRNPEPAHWRELVPQSQDTIEQATVVNHMFIVSHMHDAHSRVRILKTDGTLAHDLALPGIGSADGFTGKPHHTETFFAFAAFNTPAVIYRLDLQTFTASVFKRPKLAFNPDDFATGQVFVTSQDGTKVPVFLSHKKTLSPSPETPVYLYGYGGFNIPLTPWYSVQGLVWMEMGGIYAVANLRGGGEYGKAWHDAGRRANKQNVFDDFQAVAAWLAASGRSSPGRIAIAGGSNGGLLVGACITQRPELFGAALAQVGVMDMLRFHKFTIGWAWVDDYGSAEDATQFKTLLAYSPLHNIKPGTAYPPVLITTADHDDRVVPAHSFKFAAALQAAQGGPSPVMIRIETKAGHGAGKPTSKIIAESADQLAFLRHVMGVK